MTVGCRPLQVPFRNLRLCAKGIPLPIGQLFGVQTASSTVACEEDYEYTKYLCIPLSLSIHRRLHETVYLSNYYLCSINELPYR